MIAQRRGAGLWVFGVEQDAVQLTWRGLHPGALRFRAADTTVELHVESGPGSVLLEGLPSGRLLDIAVSGSALDEPRSVRARTLVAPPGEELCRVATLSDLHLGIEGFGHRGTIVERPGHAQPHALRCSEAALDEAIDWGARQVSMKGDLTNGAYPSEWREFSELVRRSPVPVDSIPGNHDHRWNALRGSLLPSEAAAAFGLSMATPLLVRDLPGVRVVLVDSTVQGRHGGTVTHLWPELSEAVATAPQEGGVLVVVHQQLQPHRIAEGWPIGIGRAESFRLLEALGRTHPHVLVTSGHTHRHRRWGRAGVTVTQVGATKDYPGVWAGYRVHEGGMSQMVRRVGAPDCLAWTDHTRTAAFGLWDHVAPGRLDARCFTLNWSRSQP